MDCPRIQDGTEEDTELPYKEKLQLIEKEAISLYEYCVIHKLSTAQMMSCISPLYGKKKSFTSRVVSGTAPTLFRLSILVAIVAVLIKWPTTNKLVQVNMKLLSLKTLAIYDWTKLYDEDCLINNPYLPEKKITRNDCMGCIDFKKEGLEVERLKNINDTLLTDGYLYYDIPAIVTDALKNWPKDENGELLLSISKLQELYLTEKQLQSGFENCEFSSTLDQDNTTVHQFIKLLNKYELPEKYHASWENCEPKAAKIFRLYSKRPYFLPAMTEISRANQFVLAKGKFDDGDSFTIPQQQDSASWFVILKGSVKVTISPIEECQKFKCVRANFILEEGEAAVIPTRIWTIEYTPLGPASTFMFASTVLWDDVM